MTKKEIYNHLAKHRKIFLPVEQLDKVHQNYAVIAYKDVFNAMYSIENDISLSMYIDPKLGAYADRNGFLETIKKGVEQLDLQGNYICSYDSFYQAANGIGKPKGFGNISNAATSGGVAYGFKWRLS